MIGIYGIRNKINHKIYIGKSKNIRRRLTAHKYSLINPIRSKKLTNRYLYASVQKYGWDNFETLVLETFESLDENIIKKRELYWMEHYKSTQRLYGYNLRMDSSTKMIVHESTKKLQGLRAGVLNPNFNNKWTEARKEAISKIAIARHKSGKHYGTAWKNKVGTAAKLMWKDKDKLDQMREKVRNTNQKYTFYKYDRQMNLLQTYTGIHSIEIENPAYKRHNIYAVCSGEKPTMYGYIWRKKLN